jgi:hypothetical protein
VDVLVLWGSSNDVARNNSVEGMKHILEFGRNSNHTNGILMSVLHRHDLIRNSCVNNAVEAYNTRLWKRMKRVKNVETINLGTERDFYTKCGQHLKTKEIILMTIASTTQSTGEKWKL